MKKKNLIILLIIPFVIALLSIVTINATFNAFFGDLSGIEWKYKEVEGFQVVDEAYKLEAKGVTSNNTRLAPGNNLVWSLENKNSEDLEKHAEIIIKNGQYYLKTISTGEIIITVSNEKGNVFKRMDAILFTDGVILLNPVISSSQNNIDSNIYYGKYDFDKDYNKTNAKINFQVSVLPTSLNEDLAITDKSSNLNVNIKNNDITVEINANSNIEDSYFTVGIDGFSTVEPRTYNFKAIDGVNCYKYDDLLYCSNKSTTGETIVLRKNFESESIVKTTMSNNTVLFGNQKGNSYSFGNEVYKYKTKFNSEYINQWNKFARSNPNYNQVSDEVIAGLHLKKSLYGNGYTINFHNLAYPKGITEIEGIEVPTVLQSDLFKGPLKFYTLGDPNSMPLVSAYGEDNCGIYIDTDNVIINDLNAKNCDTPASLDFLEFTGNVINVNANNVTIKNSRLQNGKSVLRSFSSMNLTLDNSLLQTSMNFLVVTGANEYVKPSDSEYTFQTLDGSTQATPEAYLSKGGAGDEILNKYMIGDFDSKAKMKTALESIQKGLNNRSVVANKYKGTMEIKDTYFYNSGLSSICFESLFNGPFLYTCAPSFIGDLFNQFQSAAKMIPLFPVNISGMSYPVSVNITGNTRFYDYKKPDNINLNGLIEENISEIGKNHLGDNVITIDDIFPVRRDLVSDARSNACIYSSEEEDYINIPVCYYGGGENMSLLTYEGHTDTNYEAKELTIDFTKEYMNAPKVDMQNPTMGQLLGAVKKCVVVTTGFEPFKFVCMKNNGYLFGETPNIKDLINNA